MKKKDLTNTAGVIFPERHPLHVTGYAYVRRHSRVLYLAIDSMTVKLHGIKKGDIIKFSLLELRRAPEGDKQE